MMTPSSGRRRLAFALTFAGISLLALAWTGSAWSGCNIIPPAEEAYPSTVGSVMSPVTTAGQTVTLRLTPCDGSPGFDPVPANNEVAISFLPAGVSQPLPTIVPSGDITVSGCAGTCNTLRFTMPSTPTLAGPAAIAVTVGATQVADVGPLFQVQELGTTCERWPESVFVQFTVLPPPNDFNAIAGGGIDVKATLDGSGSLVIPFDYRAVLPLGPGAPVARLVGGNTTLDAFPETPGMQAIDVPSSYVRSFTIDGRPLPPLLRATDAGNAIFGSTDAAFAVTRIARSGDDGDKFDLQAHRTNGGYGPIVIPSVQYAVTSGPAIPLKHLRSTLSGVSYARDEALEGNLNGDGDTDDQVIQVIDATSFTSTNTQMAGTVSQSPIFGGVALDVSPTHAAFLESEAAQNDSDLNGNGHALDDVLRVFDLGGAQITPVMPTSALIGSAFPGISRKPIVVSGPLVYFRTPEVGATVVGPLIQNYVAGVVTSADGEFVVESNSHVSTSCGEIEAYPRDPVTGEYTLRGNFGGVDFEPCSLYDQPRGMAILRDSRGFHAVFVADAAQNRVSPLAISSPASSSTGSLTYNPADAVTDGVGGADGLAGVENVAVSPDGENVYASGRGDNAVAVLAVTPTLADSRNHLSFVEAEFNGLGGVSGLADPRGILVSPDGANVYVAAHGSSAVTAFTRNTGDGTLSFLATYPDGGVGGPSLSGARDIAISADGTSLYVAAEGDHAVSVFQRDAGTGLLTFVEAKVDGVGGVTGLGGAAAVAVSPDQRTVYVGGTSASSLASFARNLPGETLTFVESSNRGGATNTMALAVSFDSEHVYQAYGLTHQDVRLFQRRNTLRAFDTDTASLRPGLNVPSGLADAGGAFAVYINPADLHPYLYDAATDSVTEIGGGASAPVRRVALSENLIALTVIQSDGVPPYTALAVVPTSAPGSAPVFAGTPANDIDVTDLCSGGSNANQPCRVDGDCPGGTCNGVVVMLTEEYQAGLLNDDDDDADAVVQVYRSATSALYSTKFQAEDFVLGGNLVAMRSNEFRQATKLTGNGTQYGGVDLNGDGDIGFFETVMEVYDLLTDTRVNSGLAAVPCDLPGCEAGHPYKIKGATVAFLTREADQGGQDLDGDGSSDDTVVEIFNPRTLRAQFFPMPAGAPNLPPLPDEFVGSTIVYQEVNEADIHRDVNEDGDELDVVTLVEGDNDEDGTFNQQDTCVETANASQRDIDLDGLGDACDPNPSCGDFVPGDPVTPPWTVKCQEKLGKAARSYLNARNGAVLACLDRVTAGKLPGGGVTSRCRGGAVGDVALLPSDDKTGAKIAKADASLAKKVASCDYLDLADLNACADGSHDVAACVAARHAEAVSLTSDMAYGEVVPTTDKAVGKCQKAIGKASRAYLKATMFAMQDCLDRRNAGEIAGNGQAMCLGSSTNSGVQLPTDPDANASFVKARAKLISTITTACPGGLLGSLDACGSDPASAVGCLECTHWRRAIAATQAVYGG